MLSENNYHPGLFKEHSITSDNFRAVAQKAKYLDFVKIKYIGCHG